MLKFSNPKYTNFSLSALAVVIFSVFVLNKSISSWKQNQTIPKFVCGSDQGPLSESGEFSPGESTAWFNNEPVSPLALALPEPKSAVLGETSEEKWIDVDLSTQTVYAMEGDKEVMRFLISSGKWAPTPTGEFRIWIKYKYTKMSGGKKENNTYYYLPNVPYVMYFYKGFGLHGAYWHNNFGQPMSHGCVNMAIPDAEKLFYWAGPGLPEGTSTVKATDDNPGTRVVVRGVAPKT